MNDPSITKPLLSVKSYKTTPFACTCPDYVYRKQFVNGVCKHMVPLVLDEAAVHFASHRCADCGDALPSHHYYCQAAKRVVA